MVYGSLLLLLVQFFLNGGQLLQGFLACVIAFAAWSMGYSYYLFRRKSRCPVFAFGTSVLSAGA